MSRQLTAALLAAAVSSLGAPTVLAQSAAPGGDGATASDAAAWCEAKGGDVQVRQAVFGTASENQIGWIDLGRSIELCRFVADDGSRVYVDTGTLASTTPTLASVAYLARVQNDLDPTQGNPASLNCDALGGSSLGGRGGGWVALDDPDQPVLGELCMFPDGSAIDEWGILYYVGGEVRGADLAPLFAWQDQDPLPAFFPVPSGGS
jgi:putative hemolysin